MTCELVPYCMGSMRSVLERDVIGHRTNMFRIGASIKLSPIHVEHRRQFQFCFSFAIWWAESLQVTLCNTIVRCFWCIPCTREVPTCGDVDYHDRCVCPSTVQDLFD